MALQSLFPACARTSGGRSGPDYCVAPATIRRLFQDARIVADPHSYDQYRVANWGDWAPARAAFEDALRSEIDPT